MARAKSELDSFSSPKVVRKPVHAPKSPAAENWNPAEAPSVGATENHAAGARTTAARTMPHALPRFLSVRHSPQSWLVRIVYVLFVPPCAQTRTPRRATFRRQVARRTASAGSGLSVPP